MRIAYRGNFGPSFSTESHVAASLEELGHPVVRLQEDKTSWDECQRAALGCDLFLWTRTWRLNDDGAYRCLERLRRAGVPSVSFHLDLYVGLQREAGLVDDPFWRTEWVFSADGGHDDTFARLGINHRWLHPGVFGPECGMGTPAKKWAADVAFVGSEGYHSEWSYRPELVAWLRKTYGGGFRLFGSGETIRGKDLNDLYATAKVIVGDSCCPGFNQPRYWSDRAYETLGRGGFLIHPQIEGMDGDFADGEHLRYYRFGHFAELQSLIRHYLDAPDERREIAAAGQAHVRSQHTYAHRMREMLEVVTSRRKVLAPVSQASRPRLGLFGARDDNRGLGNQTYEFARHMAPDKVVVVDASRHSPIERRPERFPMATVLRQGEIGESDLREFLADLDVVYIAETPYEDRLLSMATEMGVGTVCAVNYEFCRWCGDDSLPRPDLFAAPSHWRIDDMPHPRRILPFPVARDRLPFTLRRSARTFLHIVGPGTAADRNGTNAVLAALPLITADVTVVIRSQRPLDRLPAVPENVELVVEVGDIADYPDVYEGADVLVMPRRFGGLSLPLNEASSLGMPVIATDVEPQRSILPAESLVTTSMSRTLRVAPGPVECFDLDPAVLAAKIDQLATTPELVERLSLAADAYARSISWEALADDYRSVLADVANTARTRPTAARRAHITPSVASSPPGPISAYVSESHYADHLVPIWLALTSTEQGRFHAPSTLHGRLMAAGVPREALATGRPGRSSHPVLVASYVDYRAVYGRTVIFVEHGAGQRYGDGHPAYSGGTGRGEVALFLCPNKDVAEANRAAYPSIPAVVVGCAKLDRYHRLSSDGPSDKERRTPNSAERSAESAEAPSEHAMDVAESKGATRPTVALSFHWDYTTGPPEGRTAFPHYSASIERLAASGRYNLLGHAHPRALPQLRPFYARNGIEVVDDFAEVMERADVYVCDNSSTLYEFASTGRPVVVLNAPWYRRDIEVGLRFWRHADVGIQVDDGAELEGAIEQALSDPENVRLTRNEAVAAAYAWTDGRAAERAVEAIREHVRVVKAPSRRGTRRAQEMAPRHPVSPMLDRVVRLGASPAVVDRARSEWVTLTNEEKDRATAAFAQLTDDAVRELMARAEAELVTVDG